MGEHNNNEEFSFIKEQIKERPVNKRKLLHKLLWIALCGIVFGVASCVAFVVAKPKLELLTEPQPDQTVRIPENQKKWNGEGIGLEDTDPKKDGDTGQNESEHEEENTGDGGQDQPNSNGNGGASGQDGADEADQPEPVYIERDLKAEDYQEIQNKLYAIGKRGNRSIVTVTGVKNNTDWFDSAYESENQASGIIIADTEKELLILTERKVIDNAAAISITFINDTEVPASLKKYDGNTGIAIISVALEDIPEETLGKIDVAVTGNSVTVNQGTVVIAIGSPLGATYSILCGTVTSSDNTVSAWDSSYTIFTTDIMGSSKGSGALINLDGEVVGLVMQGYSSEGDQNTITALSISQLKGIIEDLSNGRAIPYLGIKVSTVTDEIAKEYGLPKGVYIKSVETDVPSPAMDAGLLEGDVIIAMNGESVLTVEEYTKRLQALEPEQQMILTVLRQNGKEYAELECSATVGVRQ
ncbi:MAG: serine protease [Lachnospiraceae bacterium]|jgi:serine protease Do|nr:serine protease [Lachnospiraceae bacterium]